VRSLFTGSGTQFNPGAFLEQTSPYVWALTGMGLNIGLYRREKKVGEGEPGRARERRDGTVPSCACDAEADHPSSAEVSGHPESEQKT
jgi:hypothetical protein